jgi:hypothetical protein
MGRGGFSSLGPQAHFGHAAPANDEVLKVNSYLIGGYL